MMDIGWNPLLVISPQGLSPFPFLVFMGRLTRQAYFWTSLTFAPLSCTFPRVPSWFIFPCTQPVARGGSPSGPAILIFCIWFPVHSFTVRRPHFLSIIWGLQTRVSLLMCFPSPVLHKIHLPPCWSSAASQVFLLWYMLSLSFPSHLNLKSVFALFLSISSERSFLPCFS